MVAAKKAMATPADSDLVPQEPGIEAWQNVTAGTIYLTRIGEYGKRLTELVYGGRVFSITPQERRLNQNACATPALDMFTNGTLQPKSLLEDEPDTPKLRNNPNMIDDKEIPKLFRLRGEAFIQRIGEITNTATVDRLIGFAREPRINATVAQFEALRLRQRALAGDTDNETQPKTDSAAGLPRAVTPK